MILGGNATLYVSDMDDAVRFYTEALGLPLRMRAGNHWAEVVAGKDLVIGLHPARPGRDPGSCGAIQIGLLVDAPLEAALDTLRSRGVKVDAAIRDAGPGMRFGTIEDMDGNGIYLWERSATARPRSGAKKPARARARRAKATTRR
jgi:predicted enzyme related to lactoylglutathione lyase